MRRTSFHWMAARMAALLALLAIGPLAFGQDNHSVLFGTVTDQSLAPAANVLVTLSSIERVFQTKSSTNGRFRFEGVPRGSYDLEFAAAAFVKQTVSVDLSNGSAQALSVVLNISSQPNMDYCGPHPSTRYDSPDLNNLKLSGVVRTYESHRPLARAELALWRDDDTQMEAMAVADGKGRFKFDSLPPGRYHLQVSRRGYLRTAVTPLLVPRENGVFIDIPIVRDDKKIIICQ
jgi:hypothetical protein